MLKARMSSWTVAVMQHDDVLKLIVTKHVEAQKKNCTHFHQQLNNSMHIFVSVALQYDRTKSTNRRLCKGQQGMCGTRVKIVHGF